MTAVRKIIPLPMSPEQFFESHVKDDNMIDALRDYRLHLETVWCDRIKALFDKYNPHPEDCPCDKCMQLRYDGMLITPPKISE